MRAHPHPYSLPALSTSVHRRLRRPLTLPPSSRSLTPTLLSLCASLLRRSCTQRFLFPPSPPPPPWISVCGSGLDSTSQNHPPDCLSTFVTIEVWACQGTVCVVARLWTFNTSKKETSVLDKLLLLKLLNGGFLLHGCGNFKFGFLKELVYHM